MAARDSPCLVRRVLVRGSVHTYDSVVKQELHSLTTAATLGEVYDGCNVGLSQLRFALDCRRRSPCARSLRRWSSG